MFKRKWSIDLLYNRLNILNITKLCLELVQCMFIYIDFYHSEKTLLIFFKGIYWLRLLGCLIVDPASQTPKSHLLAHFWIFSLIHSISLPSCSVSFSPPSLLTIFFSVHWSYFLLLHMDFFMHLVGREERLQITQILSHFSRATL